MGGSDGSINEEGYSGKTKADDEREAGNSGSLGEQNRKVEGAGYEGEACGGEGKASCQSQDERNDRSPVHSEGSPSSDNALAHRARE